MLEVLAPAFVVPGQGHHGDSESEFYHVEPDIRDVTDDARQGELPDSVELNFSMRLDELCCSDELGIFGSGSSRGTLATHRRRKCAIARYRRFCASITRP